MTIEDKRIRLNDYCNDIPKCDDCPIGFDVPEHAACHDAFQDDEFIEKTYAKIFPEDISDSVNHPAHYSGKHECIEVMRVMFGDEAVKAFCRCNSFKYRFRADRKNGDEDIKKAEWYEDYLFRMEKGDTHDKN